MFGVSHTSLQFGSVSFVVYEVLICYYGYLLFTPVYRLTACVYLGT